MLIARSLGSASYSDLDRREQAVVVADAVDEADRDVDALDVLLDQHAVGIRAQRALAAPRRDPSAP